MENEEKSWFKRHPIWTGIIGLIFLAILINIIIPNKSQDLTGEVIDGGIQNASEQVENQEQQDQTQEETHSSSQPEINQTDNQQTEVPYCIDSDEGESYYIKGYIILDSELTLYDECSSENILTEYACISNGYGSFDYKCPYGCFDGKCNSEPETQSNYFKVIRIIDGDTIEILNGEKVRLICIDTPETNEYYYQEAKNYLTNLILNKEVKLVKDVSETDRYGRLLRYIYFEDDFINELIVLNGYGKAYPYSPDTTLCSVIQTAESKARSQEIGIWAEQEEEPEQTGVICSYNAYNCDDFSTHAQAQAVFEACGGLSNDIHDLDRDNDGLACETLP